MKKILAMTITIICILLLATTGYAQTTRPKTISDLDYMKTNYYKGGHYTYKNIHVGNRGTGKVNSILADPAGNNNADAYTLTVLEEGMITFHLTPIGKQEYTKLKINGLYFISDVTGQKKYHEVFTFNNQISIDHYEGTGHYLKTVYLTAGTYYFTVVGGQGNDGLRKYTDYDLKITSTSFAKNLNSSSTTPYIVSSSKETIKGILGMELGYNPSSGRFVVDDRDYIVFPAGPERKVKITIANTKSNVLDFFKKEIKYTRDNNDKANLERNSLNNTYKPNMTLGSVLKGSGNMTIDGTSFKLLPGETKEIITTLKKDVKYTMEFIENIPTEYTVTYEELSTAAPNTNSNTGENSSSNNSANAGQVNPIIMLHSACDIPAETFDNHDYTIYVNGIDYTNNQGYMGHITNLPQSRVGQTYAIKVVVEGYEPYEETITIPKSEYDNGHSVVFVNVNTKKATKASPSTTKYYVNSYEVTQMPHYDGELSMNQSDLIMKGGSHTNNRITGGRRDGNGVMTVDTFHLKDKRILSSYTIYGNSYGYYVGQGADKILSGKAVTTHHSWAGSKVVPSGTKLYKIMSLTGSTYDMKVATGNYYGMTGSTLLYEDYGTLSKDAQNAINSPQAIYFAFGDNYGHSSNYMVLHELTIANNPVPEQSKTTLNTASNWAKAEIEKSIAAGLQTEKMTNSNFKAKATREEFCELVMTMYEKLGGNITTYNNPFTDTHNDSVIKAYNVGIINGTSSSTFSPNNSLNREQLCVMIIRTLNASGKKYELNTTFQKQYTDINQISSWARESVEILNGYKIINGNGMALDPKGTVTKEMAVLIMYRAYDMFK